MRHLDWTEPDAIGGHALGLPRGADKMEWTAERWKVSDLPRSRPMSSAKVKKYVQQMQDGSDPPAIVLGEGKPEYDDLTGELLRRGALQVWDGQHRLAAAREAGLKEIDAYVGRHKEEP